MAKTKTQLRALAEEIISAKADLLLAEERFKALSEKFIAEGVDSFEVEPNVSVSVVTTHRRKFDVTVLEDKLPPRIKNKFFKKVVDTPKFDACVTAGLIDKDVIDAATQTSVTRYVKVHHSSKGGH